MSQTTAIELSEEVQAFCRRHELLRHLHTALAIAQEEFSPIRRLEVSVEPSEEEDVLAIDVEVDGTIEQVLAMNQQYTRRWVEAVPFEEGERIILLSNVHREPGR